MSDLIGPGPDNYGEGYLDNAPEDPRAIKAIADLQSRLTAAETRVKELEKLVLLFSCHNDEAHLRAELDKLKGKS
jgi:hypothetical protein